MIYWKVQPLSHAGSNMLSHTIHSVYLDLRKRNNGGVPAARLEGAGRPLKRRGERDAMRVLV